MRFTIKREEFLKGLNIAARAVSSKVAMPVLETYICAMIALCAALGIIYVDIKQRKTKDD